MEIFTNEFVEHLADKLANKPLFTEKFMDALAEKIGEAYPNCEVSAVYGGQPVYY